jgi:hypothetical protein
MGLTERWTKLRAHKDQSQLWRSNKRVVVVVAGRGSGKTEISKRRVVRYLPVRKEWPDPKYFYALPTFNQAKRVAWEDLQSLVPRNWLARHNPISASDLTIKTEFGSTLWLLGLDQPQRAEGVQWDGGVVDESSDQKPKVVDLSLGPAMTHRDPWLWRIGVPKRYGIGGHEFKAAYDYAASGVDEDWAAFHWKSSSVLTPQQLAHWKRVLDTRDYNEQYEASWEQSGGVIFHAFDSELDVDHEVSYDPSKPIIVGSDFNVSPMAWVLSQEHEGEYGPELHVYDELFIRDTNTPATLDELDRRVEDRPPEWIFYGDASGKSRKTSTTTTDYLLIANDKRFDPKKVRYPKMNPALKDRFSSCNAMLCNAYGHRRVKIHPKCTHLIADLRERSYKEGTSEPNDKGDISHSSDAFGYIVHGRYPLSTRKKGKVGISTQVA